MVTAASPGKLPSSVDGVPCCAVEPVAPLAAHYRSVMDPWRAAAVARLVLSQRPDVVHAHTVAWHIGYGWMPIVARAGVPIVFTAHDAMTVAYGKVSAHEAHPVWRDMRRVRIAWNPLRNALVRHALRSCTLRIAVSDALAQYLRGRGIPMDRTIHNGIDTSFWKPMPGKAARDAIGLPHHARVFLLAGRLGHDKGVAATLAVLPPDALLLLAGEAYGQGAGDARVRVLGPLDAEGMRSAYAAADAVLVPSVYLDPFPTVCLEAMACGKPVIATCHGGAREAVRDGRDGWIVDPLDEPAFRKRLAWCMTRDEELKQAGESGRAHACEAFGLSGFSSVMLETYASLSAGAV